MTRVWGNLVGRVHGPLTFRLILQSIVAPILATCAGLKDDGEGRPPYLWGIFTNPVNRREQPQEGWKAVTKLFVVAVFIYFTCH